MEKIKCPTCPLKWHDGDCKSVTAKQFLRCMPKGTPCTRRAHYHKKIVPKKASPKPVSHAEIRIIAKLKKEEVTLCRVENCIDPDHFHPVVEEKGEVIPVFESHQHDANYLNLRVKHKHPCQDCGEFYEHTHKILTEDASEAHHHQRCDDCEYDHAATSAEIKKFDSELDGVADALPPLEEVPEVPAPLPVDPPVAKPKVKKVVETTAAPTPILPSVVSSRPTEIVGPSKIETYTAIVNQYFHAAELREDKFKVGLGRVNRFMQMAKLDITIHNVEQAFTIFRNRAVDVDASVASSEDTYNLARKQKLLKDRVSADKKEGEAVALSILSPRRHYVHYIVRPWRRFLDEVGESEKRTRDFFRALVTHWLFIIFFASLFPGLRPGALCALAFKMYMIRRDKKKVEFSRKPLEITSYCAGDAMSDIQRSVDGDAALIEWQMDDKRFFAQLPSVHEMQCEPSVFQVGFTIFNRGLWIPRVKCTHNELLALTKRQQIGPSDTSSVESRKHIYSTGLLLLLDVWDNVDDIVDWGVSDDDMWTAYLEKKTPTQRKTLDRARYEAAHGRTPNTRYMWFIKCEVLMEKLLNKRHPRLISSCDLAGSYLAHLGHVYYHMQKSLCNNVFKDDTRDFTTRIIYTSGIDCKTLGDKVVEYEDAGCDAIEADLMRCDGHTSEEARISETDFYRKLGLPEDQIELLLTDVDGQGRTSTGIRGNCGPSEGSGRPDTSLGTSMRLLFVWFYILAVIIFVDEHPEFMDMDFTLFFLSGDELAKFTVILRSLVWGGLQLGDDSVIFTPPHIRLTEWHEKLVKQIWDKAGHDAKIKLHKNSRFDDITYCSSRFWRYAPGLRVLGPMPFRTCGKTFVSTDPAMTLADMPAYMRGIAIGFKLYHWVPVLGPICENIIAATDGLTVKTARGAANPHKHKLAEALGPVHPDIVNDFFFSVYGIHASSFSYLADVPFASHPGNSWDLPFMEEGAIIDGSLLEDDKGDIHAFH